MEYSIPGVRYSVGDRQMVATAMPPKLLVKLTEKPPEWDPIGEQPHGNRRLDTTHRKGIEDYVRDEKNFVLNSVVLYAREEDVRFAPDEDSKHLPIHAGVLLVRFDAQLDVGDGMHRIEALRRSDPDVWARLADAGQPAVVVIDDNALHRAQDFTDLQRNFKPQTTSLAMSMDRRQPINRLLLEIVTDPDLRIFGADAHRVEFFVDSPGKLSNKLYSFKTIRYFSGTVLVGVGVTSTKAWEKAVNKSVEADVDGARCCLRAVWSGMEMFPPLALVAEGRWQPRDVRERTYLGSSNVLYALAYAIHRAVHDHHITMDEVTTRLPGIDLARAGRAPSDSDHLTEADTILAGTLVDPPTGNLASGRPAWEAAGEALLAPLLNS